MGKSALISGTGIGPGPEVTGTPEASVGPVAAFEANWTVGTDTKSSSKLLDMASSSSVADRVGVLEANCVPASLTGVVFFKVSLNAELIALAPVLSEALNEYCCEASMLGVSPRVYPD
jgi:hypothetical protein